VTEFVTHQKEKGGEIMKEDKIDQDFVLNEFGMLGAGQLNSIIGFATVGWSAAHDLRERLADSNVMEFHIQIVEGLAEIFHEIGQNALSTRDFLQNLPEHWEEHKQRMDQMMAEYRKNKS
jgi:hypothetical protein